MALTAKSLFLYGFQVTEQNRSIDFRSVALETERQATLRLGYYSLTSLCVEIGRAMKAADTARTFTLTVDRTVGGGLENRVTIATNGAVLELLCSTGSRAASSFCTLIGLPVADYTGATSYQSTSSAGTRHIPTYIGYGYKSPDAHQEVFGAVNVSASGLKEAIVHSIQRFWDVGFKYEAASRIASEWTPFLSWLIRQRRIEFTPEISNPTVFYDGTLEKTSRDSKGLGFLMEEMLPSLPNFYQTGTMTFRVKD